MRNLRFALTALGVLILPFAANATDARTAIVLCEKNPNCRYNVHDNGNVTLTVGESTIECRLEGDCICICGGPDLAAGSGTGRVGVTTLLTATPGRPVRPRRVGATAAATANPRGRT